MNNNQTASVASIADDTVELEVDLFDMYFQLIDASSESPLLYHRWTLISSVAALLGRKAYINFGFEPIYPNMYVCLMGSAGTRKSSAINISRRLIQAAGYENFARERSSKEKFIKDLSVGFDVINGHMQMEDADDIEILDTGSFSDAPPAEVYICSGELEDFLGQSDGGFISLLTNLWDNLPKYGHGKMTSKDIWIKEPTVNLIGGCTPITFNTVFPPEVIGQGMLSRLLLIYGGGIRKKITVPRAPDPVLLKFFEEHMYEISKQMVGEIFISDGALEVWDTVYQGDIDLLDPRLDSYINRRHIHYYKLCIVIAAMNLTKIITRKIAIEANTILHYTERLMPKALGEFGKSFKADNAAIVLTVLENHYNSTGEGITIEELFKQVSTNFDSYGKDYAEVIQKLKQSGKLALSPCKTKLVPNINISIKKIPYVDFNLLKEYRDEES